MTKRKGNYKPGPGRDSFKTRYGVDPIALKIQLTPEQHAYVTDRENRGVSAAEHIRNLIDADKDSIEQNDQ